MPMTSHGSLIQSWPHFRDSSQTRSEIILDTRSSNITAPKTFLAMFPLVAPESWQNAYRITRNDEGATLYSDRFGDSTEREHGHTRFNSGHFSNFVDVLDFSHPGAAETNVGQRAILPHVKVFLGGQEITVQSLDLSETDLRVL